ncbi:IscS subfamily cysteine desulfurase [Bermanella marisrubri]|uniref:cysteine desulfurase n=1 Tax=Bermanella marisrubri TaxID=207949 RepID=Q1N0G5_9GAMM|nr:IscS subfamily cysteine desulfurase [Bermanella marisrubri]EAT11699.1 cysteine desulfurase [Oceanobacter sp. RED65] [Bermanella marisrubri]QIZ83266.1 IscS subfamily cysteine desulfurase [Bermanella marisrubri]
MNPVYLDYAATTPVDPKVAEAMADCLTLEGNFANPASRSHRYGWMAEEAVETARGQLATVINADVREIVWTSGATEADNLAIKGVAEQHGYQGSHIITSSIEHKAVLDTCAHLEQQGVEVTYLQPTSAGVITCEQVAAALQENTILVSLMYVNNEVGSINPISQIGDVCRRANVLFHVDGAQAVGKIKVDVEKDNIDLLSLSGHKFYGPKGIGALYVKRGVKLVAQIHGGGHERGMRSGTLATHQIVGMGVAASLVDDNTKDIKQLRDQLWQGLSQLDGVSINGDEASGVPHILNVAFAGVDGESLLLSIPQVAVSSGSACNSATMAPSYVLKAIGLDDELAHASIRFSLGRFTTQQQIEQTIESVTTAVNRLKGMAA